jgi:hypothetical protein
LQNSLASCRVSFDGADTPITLPNDVVFFAPPGAFDFDEAHNLQRVRALGRDTASQGQNLLVLAKVLDDFRL